MLESPHAITGERLTAAQRGEIEGPSESPSGALSAPLERLAESRKALATARRRRWALYAVAGLVCLLGVGCLACLILGLSFFRAGSPEVGQILLVAALLPTAIVFVVVLLTWLVLWYAFRHELPVAQRWAALCLERVRPLLPETSQDQGGMAAQSPPASPHIQRSLGRKPSHSQAPPPATGTLPAEPGEAPTGGAEVPAEPVECRWRAGPALRQVEVERPHPREGALLEAVDRLNASRAALAKAVAERRSGNLGAQGSAAVATLGLMACAFLLVLDLTIGLLGGQTGQAVPVVLAIGGAAVGYLLLVVVIWFFKDRERRRLVSAAEQEAEGQLRQLLTTFPEAREGYERQIRWP